MNFDAKFAKNLSCFRNYLLDEFIIGMKADGQAFDEACVRENLKNFDLRALAAQGNNAAPTDELLAALFECFDN